ncbi:MAG: DUF4832 domain-containing protein [Planctomycetota bacterium]|nr:DUF4832 domain-containing protein [Planctomycetota bacterium]
MFPLARLVGILAVVPFCFLSCLAIADDRLELEYAPAPVANPLKGLVPYASATHVHFPHTMEFSYVGLSELMVGYDEYDWRAMERLLEPIAGRGHQAVFRIFLEYPGKTNVIPKFLLNDGLKIHKYLNTNTQPLPPAKVETPDYEDQNLRRALRNFIAALGKKYDGDPRIGFITAGLLGTWGEWHTYPREELFASKTVQAEVMDAYAAAFQVTPVLLRYPAGAKTWGKASNAERPFGYHDDSFAWATLDTGKEADNWFYMPALKEAGTAAMDKWKTHPIGGEIRPEAWGKVFDKEPGDKNIQSFRECVEQTHASWLMDTGMFQKKANQERRDRAELEVRRMGYEFHVPAIQYSIKGNQLQFQLEIENRGVAPFYYDWKGTYGLIDIGANGSKGKLLKTQLVTGKLTGILPNEKPIVWSDEMDLTELPKGSYRLALRVPNTLANGLPLRFANVDQDRDLDGWLSLMTIER